MKVRGYLHTPTALSPREKPFRIHYTGGWSVAVHAAGLYYTGGWAVAVHAAGLYASENRTSLTATGYRNTIPRLSNS